MALWWYRLNGICWATSFVQHIFWNEKNVRFGRWWYTYTFSRWCRYVFATLFFLFSFLYVYISKSYILLKNLEATPGGPPSRTRPSSKMTKYVECWGADKPFANITDSKMAKNIGLAVSIRLGSHKTPLFLFQYSINISKLHEILLVLLWQRRHSILNYCIQNEFDRSYQNRKQLGDSRFTVVSHSSSLFSLV